MKRVKLHQENSSNPHSFPLQANLNHQEDHLHSFLTNNLDAWRWHKKYSICNVLVTVWPENTSTLSWHQCCKHSDNTTKCWKHFCTHSDNTTSVGNHAHYKKVDTNTSVNVCLTRGVHSCLLPLNICIMSWLFLWGWGKEGHMSVAANFDLFIVRPLRHLYWH